MNPGGIAPNLTVFVWGISLNNWADISVSAHLAEKSKKEVNKTSLLKPVLMAKECIYSL